jgi:pSer/pThr/pTyr-binding forkhead associated (FHA) protein
MLNGLDKEVGKMEDKRFLLERITPLAVLKAVTPEARDAIPKNCLGNDIIGIWKFPFRIGRESRIEEIDGKLVIYERHKLGDGEPDNDAYLVDNRDLLQISREHLRIEKVDNVGYFVSDRNSACGTIINDRRIAGASMGGTGVLKDGDIIKIGGDDSPYLFEFITLS